MTHAQATASDRSIGDYIRDWRQHRRFSQLSLALEIELSQKHLSFIESGRSIPSREVVLRIASGLGVPLRIRNLMLLAAGYAPVYRERRLDHPDLAPAFRGLLGNLRMIGSELLDPQQALHFAWVRR